MNRLPLTELQFNLERLASRIEAGGLAIDAEPNPKAFVNYDIFWNVIESADGLRIDCDYNTDLFDKATIDGWLACYEALLEADGRERQRARHAHRLHPSRRTPNRSSRDSTRPAPNIPASNASTR